MIPPLLNTLITIISQLADVILAWGWLFLLFLALWVAWETYMLLKHVDYVSAMRWTFFQIKVPDESAQTPKAFENAIEVWGGIHKEPDMIEIYFEGYFIPWYSCEIECLQGRSRYIMVVPTSHAKFFEGVIYGQYPTAEITEVEDYSLRYQYQGIGKDFDMWGSEISLVKDDIYPMRTYHEFEDALAEDDKYIDPHQALVEAFSTVNPGEEFWVQIMIKPISAKEIQKWADRGQAKIAELAGDKTEKKPGLLGTIFGIFSKIPGELLKAFLAGPVTADDKKEDKFQLRIYNPSQDAEMKGILQKVSRTGYRTKIRVMHFAPAGKMNKSNYGKAIGAFKQFNSFHLNSLKPTLKTSGPTYILKQTRRRFRQRVMLLNFQWRDFWGDAAGYMMTAEELATMYHFPIKYVKAPGIQRAASGAGSPPENLPYA